MISRSIGYSVAGANGSPNGGFEQSYVSNSNDESHSGEDDTNNSDSLIDGSPLKNLSKSYQIGNFASSTGGDMSKGGLANIENMPSFIQEVDYHGNGDNDNDDADGSFIEYDTVINSPEKKAQYYGEQENMFAEYETSDNSKNNWDNSIPPVKKNSEIDNAQWKKYFQNRLNVHAVHTPNGAYKHNNSNGGVDTMNNRKLEQQDITSNIIKYDDYGDEDETEEKEMDSSQNKSQLDKSKFIYELVDKTKEDSLNADDSDQSFMSNIEENEKNKEPKNTFQKHNKKKSFAAFSVPKKISSLLANNSDADRKTSDNSNVSLDPTTAAMSVFQNLMKTTQPIFPNPNTNNNVQSHYINPHPTSGGLSNATTAIDSASSNPALGSASNDKKQQPPHKKVLSTTTPQDMGMFYDTEMGVWTNPNHTTSIGSSNVSASAVMGTANSSRAAPANSIKNTRKSSLKQEIEVSFDESYVEEDGQNTQEEEDDFERGVEGQEGEFSVLPEPVFRPIRKFSNGLQSEKFMVRFTNDSARQDLVKGLLELTHRSLDSIVKLDLSNNILNLPLKDCIHLLFEILPHVMDINLSGNDISLVSSIRNENLEVINLSNNKLKSLNFLWDMKLFHLQKLDLSHNSLNNLHLENQNPLGFYNLVDLNLSSNALPTNVGLDLQKWFPNLQKLDLSSNPLVETLEIISNGKELHLSLNNNVKLQRLSMSPESVLDVLEIEHCAESLIAQINTDFTDNIRHLVMGTENLSMKEWKFAESLKSITAKHWWSQDMWFKINKGLVKLEIADVKNDFNSSFVSSPQSQQLSSLHELCIKNTNLSIPLDSKYDFLLTTLHMHNLQVLNIKENINLKTIFYTDYCDFDQEKMEFAHRYLTNKKFGNNLIKFDGKYICST